MPCFLYSRDWKESCSYPLRGPAGVRQSSQEKGTLYVWTSPRSAERSETEESDRAEHIIRQRTVMRMALISAIVRVQQSKGPKLTTYRSILARLPCPLLEAAARSMMLTYIAVLVVYWGVCSTLIETIRKRQPIINPHGSSNVTLQTTVGT